MKKSNNIRFVMAGLLLCFLLSSCKSESNLETIADMENITEAETILKADTMPVDQTATETSASSEETSGFEEAEMLFQCDVETVRNLIVPDVFLTVEPLALIPQDSGYNWIGDEYAASVSIREVGHEPVTLSAEEAGKYALAWISDHLSDYPEDMILTENLEITPITMEAGNAEGQIVAYNIFQPHCYQGIPILGDHYNMIVDDGGETYISLQWSECKEVAICTSDSSIPPVSFDAAAQLVRQYLSKPGGYQAPNSEELMDIEVKQVELVYCFNESNGMYQPNWRFSIAGYRYVLVNCMDGQITEM